MRLAADAREFWREPGRRCLAGKHHLFFCAAPELWGFTMWGDLDQADVRALMEMITSKVSHDLPPHGSYVDIRGVTSLDASFYPAASGVPGRKLSARIRRMAVVRPPGIVGAIAEGLASQLTFPHPFIVVREPDEALRFLGVEDPRLVDELEAIQHRVGGVPLLLRRVRALLSESPGRLPLAAAAKAIGSSPRTLQRNLAKLDTSFQREVNDAQVALAQQMLLGDAKLSTIAIEVGCPSLQHFSTLFRRVTGRSPSAWRKERR